MKKEKVEGEKVESKYHWGRHEDLGEGELGPVETRIKLGCGGPDVIVEDWGDDVKVKLPIHFKRDYAYGWYRCGHEEVEELLDEYNVSFPWYQEDGTEEVLEFIE